MSIDEKQPDENPSAETNAETTGATQPDAIQNASAPNANSDQNRDTAANAQSPQNLQNERPAEEAPRPRRRGFAAMDRDRVKQIASKGGRAAHAAGTAHQFSSDEARVAGKKGGEAPHVRRGGVRRRPIDNSAAAGQNHGQGDGR